MSNTNSEKPKNSFFNSCFKLLIVPIMIALVVGGTSPWWWDEIFGTPTPSPGPPPEPTPQTISVDGVWEVKMDALNVTIYREITQEGDHISWDFDYFWENGTGAVNGNEVSLTWTNIFGDDQDVCEITEVDSRNRATRISCDNGARYIRLDSYPDIYQIAGVWKGSHPIFGEKSYNFTQNEFVFDWQIPAENEVGRGYIYTGGDEIYLIWIIADQIGMSTCQITGKTPDGTLTEFSCDNGTVATRQ